MLIPLILSYSLVVASLLLIAIIVWAALRHRNPPAEVEVEGAGGSKNFGPSATNKWLRGLRVFLAVLMVVILGFHSYWVFKAESSEGYTRARRMDSRNRRRAASGLKGWVLDRTGKLENALIRYRSDAGVVRREYPLSEAAVHVTGYSDYIFGAGGIEHAFRDHLTDPSSTYNQLVSPMPVGKDLTISIDSSFQREVFKLVEATGRSTAAVVLLLPGNEVLAMASAPSFDPTSITDERTWRRLSEQAERAPLLSPLVNRVTGTFVTGGAAFYYRPGSTFKTFTAAVAYESSMTGEVFTCRAEGFSPPGSGRPIRDYAEHVHGSIGLEEAFKQSCNQYFAQLGLKLGKERLESYARRMGYAVTPADNRSRSLDLWLVERGDRNDFGYIFAPPISRMNLSAGATSYDVALQSIGQGYDDMTVMSMALLAASVAGPDGSLVSPSFEVGAPRKAIPFIKAETAARVRELMVGVVESGTAAGAFAHLRGRISAGGKTGTADRVVLVYDRQGNPVVDRVDEDGRTHYKYQGWTDSWFIGFAPAENPQIAFAVAVENGGEGSRAAAPLAARIVEKAAQAGFLKQPRADRTGK
jgi:cell division protein FtsI/penicillin-binding protein 2